MPTPLRAIRIPNNLWARLKAAAKTQGTDASTLTRKLMQEHLDDGATPGENEISEEEYSIIANRLDPDGDFTTDAEYAGIIEEWKATKRGL